MPWDSDFTVTMRRELSCNQPPHFHFLPLRTSARSPPRTGPVYVKRTSDSNSGWGVLLQWNRTDSVADWWYNLEILGIQHPGAWSRFTLRVGRDHGYFHDRTYRSGTFGKSLSGIKIGRAYFQPPTEMILPTDPQLDWTPFWKIAQEVRRRRIGEPLVDWLMEFGPEVIVRLLDGGVPLALGDKNCLARGF